MIGIQSQLPKPQRELLRLFSRLDEHRRRSLLDFARFLNQQQAQDVPEQAVKPQSLQTPNPIPRPEQESVVAAMRRLTKTYAMIDTQVLLDQAAALMQAHILQGRPAKEIIDELETLFASHYHSYCERHASDQA